MTKNELRTQIKVSLKEAKSTLPAESERICKKLLATKAYRECNCVLAYMALFDEVDLSFVMENALKDGKKVYIPRVVPDSSDMDFFRYDEDSEIACGSFGIDEPDSNGEKFLLEKRDENILVLVPGRAFTADGKRLGRGKGYYDKYLGDLIRCDPKNLNLIGVCFPLQVVEDLPVEDHDIKMDEVVC
ncbi:MAG: 5-formyltetrahydrofolate cyclo-ligase [Treponema sp.]|nr:5-formyltetrahydrofolate cyclo-ligase [Treponema sp.]